MAQITGFTVEGSKDEKTHVCVDCAEKIGIKSNGLQVKEINTSQYRFGNSGGECLFCGFDTLDILSGEVVKGNKDRDIVIKSNRPTGFDPYAIVLGAAENVGMAFIDSDDKVEYEIAPGVKKVEPAENADKTLIVEVARENGESQSEVIDILTDLLTSAGFGCTVEKDMFNDGQFDAVIAGLYL